MTQVYFYKVKDATGKTVVPPDKITLYRAAAIGAEVLIWTAQTVPRVSLSHEGHYTPQEIRRR